MMFKPFKPLTIQKTNPTAEDDSEGPAAKRRKIDADHGNHSAGKSRVPTFTTPAKSTVALPRAPLQPMINPPSPPRASSIEFANYYSVLWRNPTNKKNKTWSGDGTLVVTSGAATFYDGSGKQMGRTSFSQPLLPGSTLSVGGKELEVESLLTKKEFINILKPKKQAKNMPPPPPPPPVKISPPKLSLKDKLKSAKSEAQTSNQPFKGTTTRIPSNGDTPVPKHDPTEPGAVVFKRPKRAPDGHQIVDVVLDPMLNRKLRSHQKEGVQFMYECVMGLRNHDGNGCILADEMGLGKTLQTIALLWTLIKQNPIHKAAPVVKKALIVCPVGVIKNWKKEFTKWLPSQYVGVLELEDAKQVRHLDGRAFKIMLIGYERLRMVADELAEAHDIDIIICDEGHRLKTVKNKAAKAMESLNTPRRVILSGTPMQNNLSEFYAMANFVNESCLGSAKAFVKDYENPIMKSRQPNATEDDIERGEQASNDLASITSPFMLRRTADILANFLPQKTEYVLFCKPTPEQEIVYQQVVSAMVGKALGSMDTALQLITILKKLCNSPSLMKSTTSNDATTSSSLTTLNEMLPSKTNRYYHNRFSSKIRLLDILLQEIKKTTDEKVVLVSNYTSTLNLMADLLDSTGLKFLRLDGSVPAKQRQGLVDQFNRAKSSHIFAFLLSAKAGGVGIDLTGASRLVLFDVDWNPATDDQAVARIHRQGQKRPTHIYRFLLKGGLEERIWQRQVVKRSLAESIVDSGDGKKRKTGTQSGGSGKATFSQEELKDLFRFDGSLTLRTHELINCPCNGNGNTSMPSTRAPTPDAEIEDEVDISGFVRSSQLSDDYPEDETGITSPIKRARQGRLSEEGDAEAEELMKYAHLDARDVCQLPDDDARLIRVEENIGDSCLMHLLRQDDDTVAGGVAYVFKKITGAKKDDDKIDA